MTRSADPITTPGFRLYPPVAVAAPWLLGYALDQTPLGLPGGDVLDESAARWIGADLVGFFVVWNGWCLILFRRHRTGLLPGQSTSGLLASGPYRISRNPLYVGLLACYVGAAILAAAPTALLLTPLAWVGLHWGAVLPEERYLRVRLGDAYLDYCRRVRRWL